MTTLSKMQKLLENNLKRLKIESKPGPDEGDSREVYTLHIIGEAATELGKVAALSALAKDVESMCQDAVKDQPLLMNRNEYDALEDAVRKLERGSRFLEVALTQIKVSQQGLDKDLDSVVSNFDRLFELAWELRERGQGCKTMAERHEAMANSLLRSTVNNPFAGHEETSLAEQWAKRERSALSGSCIFSALALESAINHYAVRVWGKTFFDELGTMGCVVKWRFLPGYTRPSGKDAGPPKDLDPKILKRIKKVYSVRNGLVHDKPAFGIHAYGLVSEDGVVDWDEWPDSMPKLEKLRKLDSAHVVVNAVSWLMSTLPASMRDLTVRKPSLGLLSTPIERGEPEV